MVKETNIIKQYKQIDEQSQAIFKKMLSEDISKKGSYKLYKDLKKLINSFPNAKSKVCQTAANALTEIYEEKGLIGNVFINASEFDNLLVERFDKLNARLPKEAVIAFNQTSKIIVKLAVNGDITVDQAVSYYVNSENFKGLYMFDKAGRKQQYKTLFKRNIRDTIKDSTRDSCEQLAGELDTDVFQISSHPSPRDKCEPYEGKLVADKSGSVTDLNGNKINVMAWSETTEGEGDGLFGYNCRHIKYPFVNGISRVNPDQFKKFENKIAKLEK